MDEKTTVYTTEEAAELLKISLTTIKRYLLAGKLHGSKIGKEWRITPDQIQRFLTSAEEAATAEIKEKQKRKKQQ